MIWQILVITLGTFVAVAIEDILLLETKFAFWFRYKVFGQKSVDLENVYRLVRKVEGKWRGQPDKCWYVCPNGVVRKWGTKEKVGFTWEPLYPKDDYWVYDDLTPFQQSVLEYIRREKP